MRVAKLYRAVLLGSNRSVQHVANRILGASPRSVKARSHQGSITGPLQPALPDYRCHFRNNYTGYLMAKSIEHLNEQGILSEA